MSRPDDLKMPFVELDRISDDIKCPECGETEYTLQNVAGETVWHIACVNCSKTLIVEGISFYLEQDREVFNAKD